MAEFSEFPLDTIINCVASSVRLGTKHRLDIDRPATLEVHATAIDGGPLFLGAFWLEPSCSGAQMACDNVEISTRPLPTGTYLVRVSAYGPSSFVLRVVLRESPDAG